MRNNLITIVAVIGAFSVLSCGGRGDGRTCLRSLITYSGSKSGAAYLHVTSTDPSLGLRYSSGAPSIQLLIEFGSSFMTCTEGGQPIDIPLTATAWIDASNAAATACADLSNPQCQPLPTDPQGHGTAVLRYGEMNEIHLTVTDPP